MEENNSFKPIEFKIAWNMKTVYSRSWIYLTFGREVRLVEMGPTSVYTNSDLGVNEVVGREK